jgi:ParE-like toxin of type II ParDE toxin-antitoxin system
VSEPAKPPRTLVEAPRFTKAKRRLPPTSQLAVDDAVRRIAQDPLTGEPKTGRLKGIRVEKFKVGPQQLLLAYQFDAKANRLDFLDVGVHENFYRDLQRHLEAR